MNLKYILRKQKLGISHPDDFLQWASSLIVEQNKNGLRIDSPSLGEIGTIDCSLWEEFDDRLIQATVEQFKAAVEELGIDCRVSDFKDTPYVRTVQSINAAARKLDIFFRIVDLRPISELGDDLGDIELIDKMVVECGCIPIGDHWIEYSSEVGRQALQAIFEYVVRPWTPRNLQLSGNNVLANQFLENFDNSVRFYGNDGYVPWTENPPPLESVVMSKYLQTRFDSDFGLVLRDSKHIGFFLFAEDII